MNESIDIWKFIAGLGLFLFAMNLLERSMGEMAGKRFKLFFKKYTSNRFMALLNGMLATAVLQSSSIVMLMVIAFAGAGIIGLSNSLGIILGANLGTTITGWIVTGLGFSTNPEGLIFPLIGIGSVGFVAIKKNYGLHYFFSFIIAVGLLFMGLGFMKESMIKLAGVVDLVELNRYGIFAFFIFGYLLTALIHSSSAMMTITLSALYAKMLPLESAAAVMIGADLGTTMTALLSSMQGSAIKKRVGLAHFFFNLGAATLALVFRIPILNFIDQNMGMSDPLYSLSAFYTGFNLLAIMVFFPFLGLFEKFLNGFFLKEEEHACIFISKVGTEVPEASLEAVRLEMRRFGHEVMVFNSRIFGFASHQNNKGFGILRIFYSENDVSSEYEKLKKMEGELLDYFSALQREKLEAGEPESLNRFILALRHGVQSAKSAKDIQHNLREFSQSVDEVVESFSAEFHHLYASVHSRMERIWQVSNKEFMVEEMAALTADNEAAYRKMSEWIYSMIHNHAEPHLMRATFLNVNREIYNSNRYLLESMRDIFIS